MYIRNIILELLIQAQSLGFSDLGVTIYEGNYVCNFGVSRCIICSEYVYSIISEIRLYYDFGNLSCST